MSVSTLSWTLQTSVPGGTWPTGWMWRATIRCGSALVVEAWGASEEEAERRVLRELSLRFEHV
jgi:hypothetical protein